MDAEIQLPSDENSVLSNLVSSVNESETGLTVSVLNQDPIEHLFLNNLFLFLITNRKKKEANFNETIRNVCRINFRCKPSPFTPPDTAGIALTDRNQISIINCRFEKVATLKTCARFLFYH